MSTRTPPQGRRRTEFLARVGPFVRAWLAGHPHGHYLQADLWAEWQRDLDTYPDLCPEAVDLGPQFFSAEATRLPGAWRTKEGDRVVIVLGRPEDAPPPITGARLSTL